MKLKLLVTLILLTILGGTGWGVDLPSAKRALELANAKFPGGTQNQVIRLEGVSSDSDLKPRQWDVTLYDNTRGNNATVVRVKDGVAVSMTGAVRLFDDARWSRFERNFTGYDAGEIVNPRRWKLDSPEALAKGLTLPVLGSVQVVAVTMTLRKLSDGDVPPVWRIALRARSRAQPKREAWIGYVDISGESGEVLANETRVEKVVE